MNYETIFNLYLNRKIPFKWKQRDFKYREHYLCVCININILSNKHWGWRCIDLENTNRQYIRVSWQLHLKSIQMFYPIDCPLNALCEALGRRPLQ